MLGRRSIDIKYLWFKNSYLSSSKHRMNILDISWSRNICEGDEQGITWSCKMEILVWLIACTELVPLI